MTGSEPTLSVSLQYLPLAKPRGLLIFLWFANGSLLDNPQNAVLNTAATAPLIVVTIQKTDAVNLDSHTNASANCKITFFKGG
jgi:hypothetical protein